MLCIWRIILENIIFIHPPTLPIWFFKLTTLITKLFQYESLMVIFSIFSSHTYTWACILQFQLSITLVSLISQSYLSIFQPYLCYYLSYVSLISYRMYKLKLLHKLTTEHTLHSRVKLSITKNLDCCFS